MEPKKNEQGLGLCDRCGKYHPILHRMERVHNLSGDGSEEQVEFSFCCWDCYKKLMSGEKPNKIVSMFSKDQWNKGDGQ